MDSSEVSYKNLTGWVYGQFVINQSDVKKVPKDTVTAGNQADISTPSEIAPQKAENKIQLTGEKVMFPYMHLSRECLIVSFYDNGDRPKDKRYGNKAAIYPGEYVYMTNVESKDKYGYPLYLVKHEILGFVFIDSNPKKWEYSHHEQYKVMFDHPDVEVFQEKKWLESDLRCGRCVLTNDGRKQPIGRNTYIAAGDYVLLTNKKGIVWHDRLGFVDIGQ